MFKRLGTVLPKKMEKLEGNIKPTDLKTVIATLEN